MRVLIGMPHYGTAEVEAVAGAALMHGLDGPGQSASFQAIGSSNLCRCFNQIWCSALNMAARDQIDHLAMVHSDIAPQPGWLKMLAEEKEATGLDMLSVTSPIKDSRGVTSLAVEATPGDRWHVKRFTMTEAMQLPETITSDGGDWNTTGGALLVNTGCWLVDLRNPRWSEIREDGRLRFFFHMRDRIVRNDVGDLYAETESEDWYFSREMAAAGIRYGATRKVGLKHIGKWSYRNDMAWGSWKTDEATL